MKKILFVLLTVFIIALTALSAAAFVNDKGLLVNSIRDPYNDPVVFTVYTQGIEGPSQKNVKVRAFILDLGIQAIGDGPFDLGISSHKSTLIFDLPEDTESGCYIVRISVSTDKVRRTKHRWICVN